ncbi:hypothetical protein F8M41_006464 [Gigaspora margarita]|uniref:Uncharacterized protein n=1 Tax=Gigaspora margarita TaxID=4874 RepID=A0A8H4A621_GIGMA|nr:hypothetical protein F8M41_006464 [Gigaspora margarita]
MTFTEYLKNEEIYKILGLVIDFLIIVIISLSNYGEAYNFSEYWNITRVQQFSDDKLLLSANTTNNANFLYLVYPNGSIFPINYKDSISFNNNSEWIYAIHLPLKDNYILFTYYDRKEQLTDLSIHGTIINLQGKITTRNDGIVIRVSYGSIRPLVDNFTFRNHRPFPTSDGQYTIVYTIESTDKTSGDLELRSSIYVHFTNDGQDQPSEEHLLF